ncbi:MAG: AAA family ATPase [Ruminococcus callidus]
MKHKPLPIGVEDFKRLVDNGYYFVDKTLMIKELLENKETVNLFTRPRRFGKTLNMSMLQRFFEATEKSNAYLFDGLKIAAYPEYMAYQGQYPVISVSLKSMKQASYTLAFETYKYSDYKSEYEQTQNLIFSRQSDFDEAEKARYLPLSISGCYRSHVQSGSTGFLSEPYLTFWQNTISRTSSFSLTSTMYH